MYQLPRAIARPIEIPGVNVTVATPAAVAGGTSILIAVPFVDAKSIWLIPEPTLVPSELTPIVADRPVAC